MSDESKPMPRVKRRQAPIARSDRRPLVEEEAEDDPATVLAHATSRQLRQLRAQAEEDAEDARTVRVSRMPVAFIGESVTDPTTVMDTSEAASKWRAQARIDEIDPMMDGDPHSLDPEPPKRTPEPPVHLITANEAERAAAAADEPALSTIVTSLLLGAMLGVGAVGITAYFIF